MARDHLRLVRCPAGYVPDLTSALDGTGPPLALLPPEPSDAALAALRPDEPVEVDGIAAVVTTSGSTGEPKPVLLPAAALHASATATLDRLGGPGHWLLALPAQYVAGLQVVVRSVVGGTTPTVLDFTGGFTTAGFAAATARMPEDSRRYTSLVPRQLARLLADPAGTDALASYDTVLIGGATAAPGLLARARTAGVRVATTYGMSETCGGCVYDGLPLAGVTTDIRADGRVRLAGPVLAAGYRLRPDLTAAAFEESVDGQRWHVTPDLGRLAADGRLEVLGRADAVAISGGVNIPLSAVERALASHPAVTAAACLAAPDPDWGERVVAFVTTSAPVALEAVRAHVAESCPRTWAPRELVVLAELPLLTSGKTDRRALSQLLSTRQP